MDGLLKIIPELMAIGLALELAAGVYVLIETRSISALMSRATARAKSRPTEAELRRKFRALSEDNSFVKKLAESHDP